MVGNRREQLMTKLHLPTGTRTDFNYEYFVWPDGWLDGAGAVMLFPYIYQYQDVLLPHQNSVDLASRILDRNSNYEDIYAIPFVSSKALKVASRR